MERVRLRESSDAGTCENCGAHLSSSFVRVFGDNDGTLHRCSECSTVSELMSGLGSNAGR
ncbi:DUF7563 family protein [Haloarchaeobius sp. HRN-SO-5]|uniref:DUF7563 family protein n=1 Tax=Haloarchaeobius sp. HRN-SO-5 TaxID=3446118 RepID=UPI003EBECA35